MAFALRSLALYASVPLPTPYQGIGFYAYATTDAPAAVIAAGYFNDAREKLRVNDVITCMCSATGTGDRIVVKVTAVPASGNVTVAIDASAAAGG